MRLFIAEKPSLGRAIADVLPKPHNKQQGFISAANGDTVTWCVGHILELAEPEDYDSKLKKWQFSTLPILPESWKLKPKYKTRSQLTTIKKLVKQASQVIHAGDPDREGQLLVDEVLNYISMPERLKQSCQRLLISDLNSAAVKKALSRLRANAEFMPLSVSALARSRADWLYGINMTRAYTVQGQSCGFNGVLSVGRVQTPVLGLVVRRDKEIEHFIPKDHYEVLAHIETASGACFSAKWQPSEACQPHMDEEGRVINKALAENVVSRIQQQPASLKSQQHKDKKLSPPLPYNLSSLQIDAAKQFNLNAKQVLDTCQALYEKHKLVTYPRSDCRYLPAQHLNDAPAIINQLSGYQTPVNQWAKNANSKLKSKAWNDSKVSAHHAIIPTAKAAAKCNLSQWEQKVYQLISRQYLAQFYPDYLYKQTQLDIEIAGGLFIARDKMDTQLGWKTLFNHESSQNQLPPLAANETLFSQSGEVLAKVTQPPAHFTDATLLSAMTGIARYVQSPDIKKILKETDGLGTEATRAGIIELLFKRGFLHKQGKSILATELGKQLITALPESATLPDMTAQWESMLNDISEKRASYQNFMSPLNNTLENMITQAQQTNFSSLPKQSYKPKKRYKKKTSGRKSANKKASQ